MATSTLYFYTLKTSVVFPLNMEKNFVINDFNSFLQEKCNVETIINFQYIKLGLNIQIKLNDVQANQCLKKVNNLSVYVGIGIDSKVYYYFITRREWTAQHTLTLYLHMDVLNTFSYGSDYILSDKTKVLREHKVRFKKVGNQFYPVLDFNSEGIHPILYKKNQCRLFEGTPNGARNYNYYLMYKTQNDPSSSNVNPVNCYLIIGETDIQISSPTYTALTAEDLENNKVYLLEPHRNGGAYYDINIPRIIPLSPQGLPQDQICGIIFKKNDNYMLYKFITRNVGDAFIVGGYKIDQSAEWTRVDRIETNSGVATKANPSDFSNITYSETTWNNKIDASGQINIGTITGYFKGLNSIDRTDAKIIKIIELPYPPFNVFEEGTGRPVSTDLFAYDSTEKLLKLNDNTAKLIYQFILKKDYSETDSGRLQLLKKLAPIGTYGLWRIHTTTEPRNRDNEPKLYHSDFYIQKLGYDSFTTNIYLEKFDSENWGWETSCEFIMTKTINSRFSFHFPILDNENMHNGLSDYESYLNIARNNELVLYNTPYITYVRSGYNYDVKNKNRQEAFSWASAGVSIVGGLLGAVFAPVGKTYSIGKVIGGVASLRGLVSAINTTIESENSMASKQAQLKEQSSSVSGSDDVDLMEEYTGNRLNYFEYGVSEKVEKQIKDLFYYFGYIDETMHLPNINTRQHFNFIQCEPVFKSIANLSDEIVEELTAKMKEGITFFHKFRTLISDYNWDLHQEYVNDDNLIHEI